MLDINKMALLFVREEIKKRSGIDLGDDKTYLLENRLRPLIERNGFLSFNEMLISLIENKDSARVDDILEEITEAMTTNETSFFRDIKPFKYFENEVLPEVANSSKKSYNIWCAACSSGQEPYSIAMSIDQQKIKMLQLKKIRFTITGTDLSSEILEKARLATYSQFEVQRGMPIKLLTKYFNQLKDSDSWQLKKEIRDMVNFKYHNLLENFHNVAGHPDMMMIRNVLIYFDSHTKEKIIRKIADIMPKHGLLFLGSTENLIGISNHGFQPVKGQTGVFIRV